MKTVIFGDIHGRTIWKDIVEKENPERVIFLGDYVSTHEGISEEKQIDNLLEILDFKENAFKGDVILLRGNHDMEALGYSWAECYPKFYRKEAFTKNEGELRNRFLKNTQWVVVEKDILFSHAGVSKQWLEKVDLDTPDKINVLAPSELFGFSPGPDNIYDSYGDSAYQPLTWIRPQRLIDNAIKGYTQVVGHTGARILVETPMNNGKSLYLCDCLGLDNPMYLILEDGKFVPTYYRN